MTRLRHGPQIEATTMLSFQPTKFPFHTTEYYGSVILAIRVTSGNHFSAQSRQHPHLSRESNDPQESLPSPQFLPTQMVDLSLPQTPSPQALVFDAEVIEKCFSLK